MSFYKKIFTVNSEQGDEYVERTHREIDNARLPSSNAVLNEESVSIPLPLDSEVFKHKQYIIEEEIVEDDINIEHKEETKSVPKAPSIEEIAILKSKDLIEKARIEAENIILAANQEAEQIRSKTAQDNVNQINQTQAECNKLFNEAEIQIKGTLEAKLKQIEQDTRSELNSRFEPIFSTLVEAAAAIKPLLTKWTHEQEEQLVKLACALSRKILRQELSSDSSKYLNLITQALPVMYGEPEIKLFVNSGTFKMINNDPILTRSFERLKNDYPELNIIEDQEMQEGFRLQGPTLKYDYDLSRILDEAEAALVRQSMASKASMDALE